MIRKHVLNEEQKMYLILYHDLPFEYKKKHLEIVHRGDSESMWPWELCDGSKSLGRYLSNWAAEQLIAREESKIQYSRIAYVAKPGDKLRGSFYIDVVQTNPRKSVSEIVFQDNIARKLRNGDIKEGARYFLEKLEDSTYRTYVIIRP